MTTTVSQAIYEAQVRGRDQLDALAKTLGVVEKAEEKVTTATTATTKGFENLVAKLDPAIKANQQYQATLERLARYEQAGIGTAQQRGVAMSLAQQKYQDSLAKSSVANDNLRQSAMAAQGVLSQLGVNIPIIGAAGPIAAVGAALGVLATASVKSVNAFEKFESQALVLDAVLKSTGFSAGRTAEQIQNLVNEIGDISKTRDAAAVMLTFKSVATDTFDRALKLADDLAAVMGTDVKSAALQLGKALEDPEKGLSAMTRSGVSFSAQQKQIIKDLFETGQVAQAQGLILDQVAKQVGGAGAAKDAGLAGAYEALSDATQRLLERWGEQIAKAWGLSAAINGIAAAIERTNKLASDPALRLQVVDSEIGAAQTRVNELSQQGLKGPAAAAQTTLNRLLEQRVKLLEEVRRAQQAADAAGEAADRGAAFADYDRRREAYDSVVRSIQKETEELRKSDLQKAISTNLSKAQVDAASAQGQEIIRLTTLKQRETDAIKAAEEAAKEAEALSKKQTEGMRRFNEELDSRMTKLAAERAGVGLSTEAALALKTVEDDLAKLREKGIPISATTEQNIRNRAAEYAKERTAVSELKAEYDNLNSAINGFGQNLVSSLIQGKTVMESMTGAATQLTQKLATMTLNRIQKDGIGSLFNNGGKTDYVQGAVAVGASGLSGYQSGSPMGGALGGLMAGASTGNPMLAIAGGAIGLIGGIMGKADKAKKEFEEAQQAYAEMATEIGHFTEKLRGNGNGALAGAISDATEKAQKYADAAHKAGQAATELNDALIVFTQRATRDFIVGFDVMMESMAQGLGADSPAVKAQQNVKRLGDTLKAFMEDTTRAGQGLAQANPAINAASAQVQQYALSLLQTAPALTDVQTSILELRGTAAQLETTLQDLGMTAENAGRAVASGIGAALDGIAANLTSNLKRQLNEASGKGYVNQLNDLLKATVGNLTDADLTNVDTSLVAELFLKQAQGIIEGAGLVGDEFNDLLKLFPNLTGVIHQSTKALQQQIDANKEFYSSLKTTLGGYLDGLNIGANSTLSPSQKLAAAQGAYNQQLGLAQGGDRTALGSITQYSDALLSVAKDFYASSAGYQSIFNQIKAQITALPSVAEANDPLVTAINQATSAIGGTTAAIGGTTAAIGGTTAAVGGTTAAVGGTTNAVGSVDNTLAALRGVQEATKASSIDISQSVYRLGEQGDYTAAGQNSIYFGPMRDYLAAIEVNTRLAGQAAASGPGGADAWYEDWFSQGGIVGRHARGGIIGAYAPGGIVGNGIWNKDSVLASYAGGRGQIALAGGEGIINAAATSMIGPSVIDLMNRTGQVPQRSSSNDNSREIGMAINRQTDALMRDNASLRDEVAGMRQEIKSLNGKLSMVLAAA